MFNRLIITGLTAGCIGYWLIAPVLIFWTGNAWLVTAVFVAGAWLSLIFDQNTIESWAWFLISFACFLLVYMPIPDADKQDNLFVYTSVGLCFGFGSGTGAVTNIVTKGLNAYMKERKSYQKDRRRYR